jgi:acyl-CoA synthetase (AMP-forming)/AMP-acid ligase II
VDLLNRRQACIATLPVACTVFTLSSASAAPPLLAAVCEVLIGNAIRTVVRRIAPSISSGAFRQFLLDVAIAYGLTRAQAAVAATEAERSGAETIARPNVPDDILLTVSNTQRSDFTFPRSKIEVVNLETGEPEEEWPVTLLFVRAMSTKTLTFTLDELTASGPRQLRLTSKGKTIALSRRFYVAT